MNLQEHKRMLREYEEATRELWSLKTMSPNDDWHVAIHSCGAKIPLPADTAKALLDSHITRTEQRVKEMAADLGITPDEICQ